MLSHLPLLDASEHCHSPLIKLREFGALRPACEWWTIEFGKSVMDSLPTAYVRAGKCLCIDYFTPSQRSKKWRPRSICLRHLDAELYSYLNMTTESTCTLS